MSDKQVFHVGDKTYRVTCCDEFIAFLKAFRKDLNTELQKPQHPYGNNSGWANIKLEDFLEGMEACISDNAQLEGQLEEFENANCWAVLADALIMGQIYE